MSSIARLPLVGTFLAASALIFAMRARPARAEDPSPASPVGVVSHLNLVSNHSEDISSLDAWKKTYIKDGMSDQDKSIAIFNTLVRYRHQANPPREFLTSEEAGGHVHDPLQTFHVYGYGQCCCASAEVIGLAQYLGLAARGRDISRHSVPEICYDDSWHLVDGSVMNYHFKRNGELASVDDIHNAVVEWSKAHPDLANDDKKLRTFAKNEGWKQGPPLLSGADKFYGKNGVNSAGWHGWPSTMQEYYDIQPAPHDFCVTMGYQLNVQLRPGERITRNFFSRGIEYTNNASPKYYAELLDRKLLGIQTQLGDRAPGRIGDGTVEWNVPLNLEQLRASALVSENLASAGSGIGAADASRPGVLVLRFPSSYVYVKGQAVLDMTRGPGGSVAVSFSDNNGLDWKPIARLEQGGGQTLDLTPLIQRRYDYRLKFELLRAGTSLNALRTANQFQCSQAALPTITEGDNQLTFHAGPQEGTVTVFGATDAQAARKNGQLTIGDFHPVLNGIGEDLHLTSAAGDATFNLATPGDMTRLRISAAYRARAAGDSFDVLASLDGGKSFKPVGALPGGIKGGASRYFVVTEIPPGTRQAQVRLVGKQANTALVFDLRLDADYTEPAGRFQPVKITYDWNEAGQSKSDSHIATKPEDTYAIHCGPKTTVKSFTMELAD